MLIKNRINNKSRLVAGYCWNWISKKPENKGLYDIVIDEHKFSAQWNLTTDGNLWIRKPESVNEVGCIHTCQGLEVDYVGVIIGTDIVVRNGEIIVQPDQRAKTDQSLKGYKKALKEKTEGAAAKAEAIIKNTYRTLMTRGQKGCYIYCIDLETNAYFQELAQSIALGNANNVVVKDDLGICDQSASYVANESKIVIESEMHEIQKHVDNGSYDKAINLAVSVMNKCRDNGDVSCVEKFADLIKDIALK